MSYDPAFQSTGFPTARVPVSSSTIKRLYRFISQDVCPWNVKFAQALPERSAFKPRAMFVETGSHDGTRAQARAVLMMEHAEYTAAYKGSAIERAKSWMLQRNACVVLGNLGVSNDVAVLEAMLSHEHAAVREHAAWAIGALGLLSDL